MVERVKSVDLESNIFNRQLIICFNRNHNVRLCYHRSSHRILLTICPFYQWIADTLLAINERGTWTQDIHSLKAKGQDTVKQQDHEVIVRDLIIDMLSNLRSIDFQHGSPDQFSHLC